VLEFFLILRCKTCN